MGSRTPKTRNGGTWTESKYWSVIRSALRRAFRYWKPAMDAKKAARRTYIGMNKRQKYESQCAVCEKWFKESETEVDHIIPCGSLKGPEDLIPFLERLTTEDGFQVLCKSCHKDKTLREREEAKK